MDLTLETKQHLIDNIWAFRFKPSEPIMWTAGQHMDVAIPHERPDNGGTTRTFTVSSAPYEGVLQITTRVSNSTFKQALQRLQPGDTIQMIKKPTGIFIWQDSPLPKVFVAGGIGIAPFYSILKQRVHEGLPLSATLLYEGRTDALPFKEELAEWAQKDGTLTIQYAVGEPLTVEGIAARIPNLNHSLVYVSGPESMVEALSGDLTSQGLRSSQLKIDGFRRYTTKNY